MKKAKKIRLSLLIAILILNFTVMLSTADSYAAELILGDVNDDGEVNSDDAIYLLRHTLAPSGYPLSQSGNVDGKGGVTSDDAIYLLRYTLAPNTYPLLSCDHNLISHEAKSATCTEIGWEAYTKCLKCNFTTYEELPALGHDITEYESKAPSCTSIGWDAYESCSRCEYSTYVEKDILTHTYVNGACFVCGASYISPNGFHAHVNKLIYGTSSTCAEAGLSDGVICTACGKTLVEQNALPLLPHSYEQGKCSLCGKIQTESEGLLFIDNGDGSYSVGGIGECTDTQVIIPEKHNGKSVTAIASDAFAGNNTVVQITVPSSVKTIGKNAFYKCLNLSDVIFSEGLEVIEDYAFMYCISLKSLTIPDSVTDISTGAFIACDKLKEATLGKGISKISEDVFFECYRMETVNITAPLSSVGGWSFFDCDSLSTVNYAGTAEEWNSIDYGKYWDENSGNYTVVCKDGESVHKHSFDEWQATDTACMITHKCVECGIAQTTYAHGEYEWNFTSSSVIKVCTVCDQNLDSYTKSDTIIQLDFDKTVAEQIKDYPYFTLVSDGQNAYQNIDGRSAWDVNSSTFIDYDKRAFNDLEYYSITFDLMIADKGSSLRDNSVFSFVPGYKNGGKVGESVGWIWQIKYLPLLDRLSTKALNGTAIPYKTVDDIPDVSAYNDSNGVTFTVGNWVTVDAVCDVSAGRSYIFVDGKPIGSVSTFDYNNKRYADAFTLRFCDNAEFDTKIDNFKILAMTSNR